MLRLLSDEHLDKHITTGLRHRVPGLDIVRVQDVGLTGTPDPDILEWAANQGRILISIDRRTMIGFAYDRVTQGLPMPGLFVLPAPIGIGQAIDAILLPALASDPGDGTDQVVDLPL